MNSGFTTMFTSTMLIMIVVLLIFLTAVTVSFILYNKLSFDTLEERPHLDYDSMEKSTRKSSKRRESNISGNTNITMLDETINRSNRDLESFYWVPHTATPDNCHFNAYYNRGLISGGNTIRKSQANIYLV